ncbi:hypothetical protein ACFX15_012733 [Malus domestica]
MTYVLSAMFGAEPDQPATMEGDYLITEPMMAHVSVEVAEEEELGKTESSKTFQNAHLEGVPFKRVLFDGGAAVNILPAKQMNKI